MGFVYGIVFFILRVNISVAIVSMSGSPAPTTPYHDVSYVNATSNVSYTSKNKSSSFVGETCERLSLGSSSDRDLPAELDWDKTKQSLVLSSFFYGYIITQLPGGWIAGRYGGKHVISGCIGFASVLTMLIPGCARTHVNLAIVNRAFTGFILGATGPAWYALVGVWALPTERSRFMAIFWFGTVLGTIIGYSSAGYLCVVGFDNGWGSVFYVHGICGIVFTVCWSLLVFNSPDTHPRIQDGERDLLYKILRHAGKKPPVPWIRIMTSFPVWCRVITHAADFWLLYLLLSCLPLFMKDVLNFDIQSNGVFSSLPFLSFCIGLVPASILADYINKRQWLRATNIRKIFQVTGNILVVVFIVITSFITCERRELVILCLCLCTFFQSLGCAAGYPCNPVDMAPRFASVIFGISNTIATFPGFIAPLVVSEMTPNRTQEEWRPVFYLTAGIVGVATIVYGLGATSELEAWSGQLPVELQVEISNKEDIPTESSLLANEYCHETHEVK